MPPSPILNVTVDEVGLARVCAELRITVPVVRIIKTTQSTFYGDYMELGHRVRLFAGFHNYDRERLPFVQGELVRTLLHELRHAWQAVYETTKYRQYHSNASEHKWAEDDAEEWALANCAQWRGLVKVRRRFHGSGMSKLAAAQNNVRRSV